MRYGFDGGGFGGYEKCRGGGDDDVCVGEGKGLTTMAAVVGGRIRGFPG